MAANGQPKMDTKPTSTTAPLKPALVSIRDACKYMGGVSRAKFYSDVLPQLETVHLGTRHFVVVASMDRFIADQKQTVSGNENPTFKGQTRTPRPSGNVP
jgi:hypothetical protein